MNLLISGVVQHGYRQARAVGFPTANISLAQEIFLEEGTYAGFAQIGDTARKIPSLVFYGVPHMIPEVAEPRCEVHLLEDVGDLYGKHLSIELIHFIRPNEKFSTEEALAIAIQKDYEAAKTFFASNREPLT